MSFLGLSTNEIFKNPVNQGDSTLVRLPLINFYYDKNTHVIVTSEYQLFIVGQAIIDPKEINIKKALTNAKGTFSFVLAFENEVFIGTDSMGFYPLYYTPGKNFNFANSITHLKHRLTNLSINWDAWDELLNGSNDILGEKTVFSEISRLRPGQTLHLQNEKLHIIENKFFTAPAMISDVNEYIEENNKILRDFMTQSALAQKERPCVIPLTSGHDSRRLAVTASSSRLNYQSITQKTRDKSGYDKDTFVSKQLSKLLNITTHQTLNMPSEQVIQYHKAYRDYWTGFESPEHEWSINIIDSLPQNSFIFDGIIGDITVNNSNQINDPSFIDVMHNPKKLVEKIYQGSKQYSINPSLLNFDRRSTIKEELMRFTPGLNQLYLFKTFNRGRRNIGSWFHPFLQKGHNVSLPYANPEFFSQALSLDESLRFKSYYQLECLKKINPLAADLPSSRDSSPPDFWRDAGANKTTTCAKSFSQLQVPLTAVWPNLEITRKEFILDQLGSAVFPVKTIESRGWRLRPLQRLALFISWLNTDESELPALFDGEPPFLEKFKPKA